MMCSSKRENLMSCERNFENLSTKEILEILLKTKNKKAGLH